MVDIGTMNPRYGHLPRDIPTYVSAGGGTSPFPRTTSPLRTTGAKMDIIDATPSPDSHILASLEHDGGAAGDRCIASPPVGNADAGCNDIGAGLDIEMQFQKLSIEPQRKLTHYFSSSLKSNKDGKKKAKVMHIKQVLNNKGKKHVQRPLNFTVAGQTSDSRLGSAQSQ